MVLRKRHLRWEWLEEDLGEIRVQVCQPKIAVEEWECRARTCPRWPQQAMGSLSVGWALVVSTGSAQ